MIMINRQSERGEVFGGITYSAVAKLYKRFANNVKEDRKLRKKLIGIEREMSNVPDYIGTSNQAPCEAIRGFDPLSVLKFCVKLLICTVACFTLYSCNWLPYQLYDEPTWIFQALGSSSELRLFIDFRRVMCRPFDPRKFIIFETPRCENIKKFQEVVVINSEGLVRRVSIVNGITFQAGNSDIFVVNDDFYLYQSEGMGQFVSLFKWKADHFELIPMDEADKILGEAASVKAINAHMKYSGWQVLSRYDTNYEPFQESFKWNNEEFRFSIEESRDSFSVSIRNLSNSQFEPIILEYSRNREIVKYGGQKLLNRLNESYMDNMQEGHVKPRYIKKKMME